jgi:ribonuclease HI
LNGCLTRNGNQENESLENLLERFKITNWDFLIVGDGSGSDSNNSAGWASISIERETGQRLVRYGSVSHGTVNFAEAMAYLQPLTWIANREADRRSKSKLRRRLMNIHILTDSQYCQETGDGKKHEVNKNAGLWACIDGFVRQGFAIHWHKIGRETIELNRFADRLSKMARRHQKGYNAVDAAIASGPWSDGTTVYDINPAAH